MPVPHPPEFRQRAVTERWADEIAATRVEDRRLAARALARAALAARRARQVRFAAFSHRDTAERVIARHHPRRRKSGDHFKLR